MVEVTSRLDAVRMQADDPRRLAEFWAEILGRVLVPSAAPDAEFDLLPTDDFEFRLRCVATQDPKPDQNALHLHLTSTSLIDQLETVRRALALGACHIDVGQTPDEGHLVLADPEGNEFCVIEPGSSFLAGCGFLAEFACDGTRAVGHFWSGALGWPLVWDQDDETAVQSAPGGPKIAWGGPPVTTPKGRGALHLDLTIPPDGDLGAETARLVSLGASLVSSDANAYRSLLLDPDGNEFGLRKS